MNYERNEAAAEVDGPLFAGRIRLKQFASGHRVGTDAVLLAAASPPLESGLIIDAGAGVGAVGLAVAARLSGVSAVLAEIDPQSCRLAEDNIHLNGLSERVRAVSVDLLSARARRAAGLQDGGASLVMINPPFYEPGTVRPSPDPAKARAHVLDGDVGGRLSDWIRMATALAANGGFVTLIHRADRLGDILAACAGRLGDLRILPAHPKEGLPATRIVARGIRGSRAPLQLLPGIILHRPDGGFTPLAEAIHKGQIALPFD